MAGTKISTSPNISILDSRIFADTCAGNFIVDVSPSTFIGSGASNVLGVKVKITNPYEVVIKPYLVGYDIAPPLTTAYEVAIPTQAGKIQHGTYTIAVQLTDEDSATYEIIKTVNVCSYTKDSHPCDNRINAVASCKNGTLTIALAEPPIFKGLYAESRTISITVDYPTASGLPQLVSTHGYFAMQLFQGEYKIVAEVCATYNLGNNVYLRLTYEQTVYKNVKCLLDYTCIWPRIKQLQDNIKAGCSQRDKEHYASVALEAMLNLRTAELANDAGEDASEYIIALEKLLGCQCTCDCGASPIVNGTPSTSIAIEGCGVEKTTVGLTDVYTVDAVRYFLTLDDPNNILSLSGVSEYGCTIYQQLSLNAGNMYQAVKNQIGSIDEYNYWASVIKLALAGLDTSCLTGATNTLANLMQAIINKACAGGSCSTSVSGVSATQVGADVLLQFTQSGGYNSDIYVDGILKGTVLAGVGQFLLVGFADGASHAYVILPKCSNGSQGTSSIGSFAFLACPSISPPVVSSNSVNDVVCPYDLTALVSTPPSGIETEWHTANNTNSNTLVADPTAVSSGVYYAFAKNGDGCYSTSTVVTVICQGETSCTAPQTLLVENSVGGFKVSFNSAAFPPPSNSYTVKRKAAADPDVDGSYTTIGTPTYNASSGKWEITDATGADNTLYTYKAISNCASTTPSTTYTFANLDCPVLSLTPAETEIAYEFTNVGGQVDKYVVKLYDSTGAVLLYTHTIVPAFSSPISGLFEYLTAETTYKVEVTVYIGTFSSTCDMVAVATSSADTISGTTYMNLSNPTMAGSIEVTTPGGRTLRFQNFSVCGLSNASITISGGIGVVNNNISSGTPNDSQNVDTLLPVGSYTFTGTLSAGCTSAASISFI